MNLCAVRFGHSSEESLNRRPAVSRLRWIVPSATSPQSVTANSSAVHFHLPSPCLVLHIAE